MWEPHGGLRLPDTSLLFNTLADAVTGTATNWIFNLFVSVHSSLLGLLLT